MKTESRRVSLREALADELATVRVLNGALLSSSMDATERLKLTESRHDSLTIVRRILTLLHPSARATRRAPRKVVSK